MYIIDSSVFIEAKKPYYAFDLAPGFWEWLDLHHHEGALASIEQVKSEIIQGNDKLREWAKEHPDFFLPFDARAVEALRDVTSWAMEEYPESAADEFLRAADSALVAYGAAHGHTIVTQEVGRSRSKKRIKIPDACDSFNVDHMNNFTMLNNVGIRLVL